MVFDLVELSNEIPFDVGLLGIVNMRYNNISTPNNRQKWVKNKSAVFDLLEFVKGIPVIYLLLCVETGVETDGKAPTFFANF